MQNCKYIRCAIANASIAGWLNLVFNAELCPTDIPNFYSGNVSNCGWEIRVGVEQRNQNSDGFEAKLMSCARDVTTHICLAFLVLL